MMLNIYYMETIYRIEQKQRDTKAQADYAKKVSK
jgi:hypothetical protein